MPILRKKLAGAAAIGIAAWGLGGVSRQPTSARELCWSLSFFIKAPMLIFREALELFYRRFAYFPLAKYAFLF